MRYVSHPLFVQKMSMHPVCDRVMASNDDLFCSGLHVMIDTTLVCAKHQAQLA